MKQFDISIRQTIAEDESIRNVDYRNLMCEIHEIHKRCKAFSKAVKPGCLDHLISDFFKAVQGKHSEL